jgi:hypothetical protein
LVHIADNISAQGITDFFPTAPFYITIMPKTPTIGVANSLDSEIIKITNVGHDQVGNAALTGVRAQRDTTAKAFSTGDIVTVSVYAEDAVFLSEDGTTETESPSVNTNDIVDGSIISEKLANGAVNVAKIEDGAVSNSKLANGAVSTAKVANDAITPAKASFTKYSTAETVIGTWYNGKPIYRRVFTGTASLTANNASDITLVGSGIDDIISAKGRWKYYTADAYYALIGDAINEGAVYSSVVQPAPGKIVLRLRTSYTLNSDYVVAVEYTKTTD